MVFSLGENLDSACRIGNGGVLDFAPLLKALLQRLRLSLKGAMYARLEEAGASKIGTSSRLVKSCLPLADLF